jgi:hypothetical protein
VEIIDQVPASLRITSVTPKVTASGPQWKSCTVTGRGPDGYGGLVTCVLDRMLGYGDTAPDVILAVEVNPQVTSGVIVNVGTAVVVEDGFQLPTLSLAGSLALTGLASGIALQLGIVLLLAGGMLLVAQFLRRRPLSRRSS